MKYIITESQYKTLIEDDDRLNRMAEKYLNTVFDNLTQVDTKFGSGFKFNDDNGYAILVSKTNDGKQLAIASPLVQGVTPMLNGLLDLDNRGIVKTIGKYCREVLGIDYDYIRVWPIKIPGHDEDVISEVNEVEDSEDRAFYKMLKNLFKKGGIKPPNEFKRRMSDDFTDDYIHYLINKEMEENDPNDFSDEFEFADNIISWVVQGLNLPDEIDEDDVINYLKDNYSDSIFDYHMSNSDDDDEREWDDEDDEDEDDF